MTASPLHPRLRLASLGRLPLALWLVCLGFCLVLAGPAQGDKPDPGVAGGGAVQPREKADPGVLGVKEIDPKLLADFIRAYDADFGPVVAIDVFVLPNPTKPNQRAVVVDTELLAAQVRRVWTDNAPDVEVTSVAAGKRNKVQTLLAQQDNDPAGVAKILALELEEELVLVIKCYPNTGRGNQPDFDVVFELLDTQRGELVSTGRGRWFQADQVMPAEILARAITRDVWRGYVNKRTRRVGKQNFTLKIAGLADRAAAQTLADELAIVQGSPVQLRSFSEGVDVTQTDYKVRLEAEVNQVAETLAAAAKRAGMTLVINSAVGDTVVARIEADAPGNTEWYQQWIEERSPRRVRLLAGWSVDKHRPLGSLGQLEQADLTGADFVSALSSSMTSRLTPISNTDLVNLKDQALADAMEHADEAVLAELLRTRYPDEIVWIVAARPVKDADASYIRVTTMIVDTLTAQTLTVKTDDYRGGFDSRFIQRKADEYVVEAVAGLQRLDASPIHRQTVMIAGLDGPNDRDLLIDAIASRLPRGAQDVKLREAIQNDPGGEAAIELEIKTQGDPAAASRMLRRAIFNELGWPVHEYRLNPAIILRVKNALDVPEWATLTGDPAEAGDLLKRVQAVLANNDNPAVLSFIQAADHNVSADQLDTLQTRLNEYFVQAGVRVLDSAVAPELAQHLRYNPKFQDDFSLAAALRDQVRADWVLLGYVHDTSSGLAGSFRLVDLRRAGQFLVGISVPDLQAAQSRKVKVDRQDPASLARFIAGRTLGGLLRLEGRPHRLEVIVRGAKSGEQILALSQQIATNIPAVVSVENLYFDPSAAGFFVVHRGKFETLAMQIDLIRSGLPFELQSASFDQGVWLLTIDAPTPVGPAHSILPGQGVLVAPVPKSSSENIEAPDPGGPTVPALPETVTPTGTPTPEPTPTPKPTPVSTPAPSPAMQNNNVAVVIGVNDLYNNQYAKDLNGAVPDAQAMALTLTKFAGYREDRVTLIADGAKNGQDAPTRDRIMTAVKAAADQAGPDDMLIVTFSGHGFDLTTESGKSHTVLVPADFENTLESSILLSELRQIINASRAGEKVLIIDACHAAGTAELPPLNAEGTFQGTGIVTFAACKFDQTSLEDPSLGTGVFTHWIIRGLTGEARGNDKQITAFELFEFVRKGVPGHAARIGQGHKQNPVFHGTITGDFPIVEIK